MKHACNRARIFLLAILIVITSTGLCQPIVSLTADSTVTATSSASFTQALTNVSDGGTIRISGTCTLPSTFTWPTQGKSITITGATDTATLDASALSSLVFGDNVTFDGVTLKLRSGGTVYANGHRLVIRENVNVQNVATLYGGGNTTTVASTDMTVLAGTYAKIYGGGRGGLVTGDVHTYVGGNVNQDIDVSNHSGTNNIFGGCNGGIVKGSVYLTVADNAQAHYLYGGSNGTSATVKGAIHLDVKGGKMMSIYGGGTNSNAGCTVITTITGGTVEQVFGANESASHTGDIILRMFGGTVTRRIYGGCYNNYGTSSGWSSARGVNGDISLVIGSGANITFSSSENDRAIYATSRQKSDVDTGTCKLIYSDSSAHTKYKNKVGAQDFAMKLIMSGKSAADSTHTLNHQKTSDTTITESCNNCSHTATASLVLDPSLSCEYTGGPVCPVTVFHTGTWYGEEMEVTYSDNVSIGTLRATATAIYARNSITLSLPFSITKVTPQTPNLTAVNETVQGQANGKILGLTPEMEYSSDGVSFSPVTDPDMELCPGVYYVRIPETDTHFASKTVTVTIKTDRHVIDTDLLEIKYQLPLDASVTSVSIAPRLIAALDTLLYSKVGFEVSKKCENGEWSAFEAIETNVAFISIMGTVNGTDVTYTPDQEYGEGASYFFVQNMTVTAEDFDIPLRIRAYVVTQDGYTVYGNAAELILSATLK